MKQEIRSRYTGANMTNLWLSAWRRKTYLNGQAWIVVRQRDLGAVKFGDDGNKT